MNIQDMCINAKMHPIVYKLYLQKEKNQILSSFSHALIQNSDFILSANAKDLDNAVLNKMNESMQDRLLLTKERIDEIAKAVLDLIELTDPVGTIDDTWKTSDGLTITKKRVPIGVIGIIYESRPNVTVDAASICIKTGNTVILKGGKEAINTNIALIKTLQSALVEYNHSPDFVQLIESTERAATMEFMQMSDYVDVLIPRGSGRLIKAVMENSKIPVLETGAGNCHIFVDSSADFKMALDIIENAKVQRPSVCNAVEKVLIHESIASDFLTKLYARLNDRVQFKGCDKSLKINQAIAAITEEELYDEFLDYKIGTIIVKDTLEAIAHINKYSSSHSESIITKDEINAELFLNRVTSSTVYHNASTRFTDGSKFGYGAEIGISTSKLHARGPMGLKEMTTTKNIVYGTGQIRK